MKSPLNYYADRRMQLDYTHRRLSAASTSYLNSKRERFVRLTSKLDAMSPLKVLARGYAMTQKDSGEVVRSVNQVELGERITVSLSDGKLSATVMNKEES